MAVVAVGGESAVFSAGPPRRTGGYKRDSESLEGGVTSGSHTMKKRYVDASRVRKMKKLKITERLSER